GWWIGGRRQIGRSVDPKIARPADEGGRGSRLPSAHRQPTGRNDVKQIRERWAPLAGLISVACSLVGVMLVLNQPQTKDSDAKISAYFADHSHRVHAAVGFFVFLTGMLFLLAFLGSLRERLLEAEGQPGRLSALAFGAGSPRCRCGAFRSCSPMR